MNVSILVPIYSVERYIQRCAISLFEQTYNDIEYIFVDDCTPDDSISILNNVINQYPFRKSQIRVIKHSLNKGLSAVRNTCIKNATGDFLLFVDSDDYLEKDAVEKLVKAQLNSDSDIVTGQAIVHKHNCEYIMSRPQFYNHTDFVADMLQLTNNHTVWGRLIRKSLFDDYNIHTLEGINIGEDMQLMSQLSYHSKEFVTINDIVYHYDNTNMISYMNSYSFNDRNKYINRLLQDIESVKFVYNFFYKEDQRYIPLIKDNLRLLYRRLRVEYFILNDKENYYFITYKLRELNENLHVSFMSKIKENFYVSKILTKIRKY